MKYNPNDFERPSVTVDTIVFTVVDQEFKVLLIKRGISPQKGVWAIPGGFVQMGESLEDAAGRELVEETGAKDVYMEQLYTFGDPKRDPRTRVISVVYFSLINSEKVNLRAGSDAVEAAWFPLDKLPALAFDHKRILEYARKRVVWKLEYTNIVYSLLPKYFSLTQLQKAYETVLGRNLDKRNFRKKFLKTDLIKETKKVSGGAHRPAVLYEFVSRKPETIKNPFGQFLQK